jgi:hypothetical protein
LEISPDKVLQGFEVLIAVVMKSLTFNGLHGVIFQKLELFKYLQVLIGSQLILNLNGPGDLRVET